MLRRAPKRQCHESLCGVLDIDLVLLARIEHQMLELLHWCIPTGLAYQTYAEAIFDAASQELGRRIVAPQVLPPFEEQPRVAIPRR